MLERVCLRFGDALGRRRRPQLAALAALAITATGFGATAQARAPLTTMCNSNLLVEAGKSGAGWRFEVSMRPRDAARQLRAHGGTDRVWDDLWRCVPGHYRGARVTAAQGESIYQQLYCHVKYGFSEAFGGPTWDLEAHRPPIAWNRITNPVRASRHKCNW